MVEVIYYLIVLIAFIILIKKRRDFIILIPAVNVFLDSGFSFFPSLSAFTYVRPTIFLIMIYFFRKEIKANILTRPLFAFLGYTFLLVFFSTTIFFSLKGYMQVFISMIMFVLAFLYFDNNEKLINLNRSLIFVILFSIGSSILGYVFGVGRVLEYSSEEIIGLLGSGGMYSAAFSIALLPLLSSSFKRPFWRFVLYAGSLLVYIFILLNVRRIAILIPIVGLLSFFIFSPARSKMIKIFIGVLAGIVVLLMLSPFYQDILTKRFLIREERGRFNKDFYKTEGRYIENVNTFTSVFSFEDPKRSLIGSNIFASGRENSEERYRMLHTDIASILGGSGIIGITIYLIFYYYLFRYMAIFQATNSNRLSLFRSTYYSVLMISVLASINGSITLVSLRTLIFLYLGAMISMIHSYNKELLNTQE
jgi:hypothetical protein